MAAVLVLATFGYLSREATIVNSVFNGTILGGLSGLDASTAGGAMYHQNYIMKDCSISAKYIMPKNSYYQTSLLKELQVSNKTGVYVNAKIIDKDTMQQIDELNYYKAGFNDSLWMPMYGGSNTGHKRPRLKQFLAVDDFIKTVDIETYLDEIGFVAA